VFRGTTGIYELARWLRPAMAPMVTGLLHRHLMIDHLLEEQDPAQVLELAAGLSARGVRYTGGARPYVEVDLAPVLAAKERLLGRSPAGREVLGRPNLRRVAGDATQLALAPLLAPGRPALVIAEGLHMYLDVATQRRLWRHVAEALGRAGGGAFVFDRFQRARSPHPGPVSRAVLSAMRRWQHRIGFQPDRRDRRALVRDLGAAGFDRVEAFHSRDVAHAWGLLQPNVPTDALILVAHRDGAEQP
jgi:O-methyltransferase involved in polyketide biosynthesis